MNFIQPSRVTPVPLLFGGIAWSWAWWFGAIALGGVETTGGAIGWLVGGFGPAVAVVTALRRSSPEYRASFRHRVVQWRVSGAVGAAAVALTVGPKLIATALAAFGGHSAARESIALSAIPVGNYALSVSRGLGNEDLVALDAESDAIYFTLCRGTVLRYPAALAMPLAILGALALAGCSLWRAAAG